MINLANITSTYRSKLIIKAYKEWVYPKLKVLGIGCESFRNIAYRLFKN